MIFSAITMNNNLDNLKAGADFTYIKTYNSTGPDAWLAWNNSGHVAIRPMEIIGKDGKYYLVLFYFGNYHLDREDGTFKTERRHAIFPISENEKSTLLNSNTSYDRIHELLLPYLNQLE